MVQGIFFTVDYLSVIQGYLVRALVLKSTHLRFTVWCHLASGDSYLVQVGSFEMIFSRLWENISLLLLLHRKKTFFQVYEKGHKTNI